MWAATIALSFVLAACGSASKTAAGPTTTTQPVAKFASVVATTKYDLDTWVNAQASCRDITCDFATRVFEQDTKLANEMGTAASNIERLGLAPAPVRTLVRQTTAELIAVEKAYFAFDQCVEPTGDLTACTAEQTAFDNAWPRLRRTFAGWAPYL